MKLLIMQLSPTSCHVISLRSKQNGHVRWIPCHHGLARPQVADGDDGLQICKVAANVLSKQSGTADRGYSSSLEVTMICVTCGLSTL
jgi:hypothetical protein